MSRTPEELREIGFEKEIEDYFLNNGYLKGKNEEYDVEHALDISILFEFLENTQPEKIKKLKEYYGNNFKIKIISRIADELNSRGTVDVLRHQVKDYGVYLDLAYFKPVSKLNPETLALYNKNIFTIYRQIHYSARDTLKSIDMLICLNGLPIAVFELKNQISHQTVLNAIKQFREKRDPREILFQFKKRAIVFFAVDNDEVYMTTKLAGEKTYFLPFNKGDSGGKGNLVNPSGERTSYLWEDVLQKDSLLDILQKFINILSEDRKDENGNKYTKETLIFPRYHQLDAVRKLVVDAKQNGPGKRYLIQHSAGSGKTLSISWLAHHLSNLHDTEDNLIFNSIVVITDRKVLDKQLQDSIYQLEHVHGVVQQIDKKSKQLAKALMGGVRIVISTIQKFSYILEKVRDLDDKTYAIIIDEAHSSFSGEYMGALKRVLAATDLEQAAELDQVAPDPEDLMIEEIEKQHPPTNISFFAFTATPKNTTIEKFGLKDEQGKPLGVPFHLYSMRQAIEEGFILDVLRNYVTYQTYFQINKKIIEDPIYNKSKAARSLARFVSLHPHVIVQKTEIIIEHFQSITRHKINGRAKAMVVTSSRLHALRYKKAFDKYVKEKGYDDIKTLVAFSGTVKDGGINYKETEINKFKETELPEKFGTDEYQVLIVAEKYQTGFDQPLLHTMYVDKKLPGLKAVQTLSRLNRISKGKDDTFILDFVNKAEDIQEAFRPYYETTKLEEFTDPNILYQLESKIKSYGVYAEGDVKRFIELFLIPKEDNRPRDRALINVIIDTGVSKYSNLPEIEQDEFKSKTRSYTRFYSFILQITYFTDTTLHKLYLYLTYLLRKLPKRKPDTSLNLIDEIALEYYKNEKIFEGNISLQPNGESGPLGSIKPGGTRKPIDEKDFLSTIIEKLNDIFGTEFTDVDSLSLEQIKADFAANEELIEKAKANNIEDFKFAYDRAFIDIIVNRMKQNETFFTKILNDDEFKNVLMGYLLPEPSKNLQNTA